MNSAIKKEDRTMASLLHLSAFTKYFIPLGNFIFPLVLWLIRRENKFIDHHGKQALNFQISIFLYFIVLVMGGIAGMVFTGMQMSLESTHFPFKDDPNLGELARLFPFGLILGGVLTLLLGLFILEIFAVVQAAIKASEGKTYKYPLSINFLGANNNHSSIHQSENEQFNNTQN
ncbi:MAG: DUF4870 domain-containing protein [Salegentibacter sp.]|uniref:DUF4870 domain-containing protein n=1 Tax=Salegentibacter sp. TaxID=1903072 RepID=UPI0028702862|nr:DUF4870 domain-containing protein [Salegentibacter sp.]MDR9457188.1 DUF4870 domain-containing protein [Salegentibacter sp.]